jgi:hypothetical protein
MAIDEYLRLTARKAGQFLFAGRGDGSCTLTTRQYARLVQEWVASVGPDPAKFGTHSLCRTKAVLIYRRTGNFRAVQLLLGHSKIESTVRYLGSEPSGLEPLRVGQSATLGSGIVHDDADGDLSAGSPLVTRVASSAVSSRSILRVFVSVKATAARHAIASDTSGKLAYPA